MLGVSAIWALDDFTESNGATEVIPGSHLWADELQPEEDDARAVPIVMPAGSVVVFAGSLYHRGGANRSQSTRLGFTPQYCEPWLRQLENMVLAVPPAVARQYSVRVQELLGYSIAEPSFMGYVDGVHPRRLVDPDYRSERRPNAGIPDALLRKS
jgi:ectoine hydroxylase-related dioxygenase (phytanoyl-CoA dioxygenase family)